MLVTHSFCLSSCAFTFRHHHAAATRRIANEEHDICHVLKLTCKYNAAAQQLELSHLSRAAISPVNQAL